MSVDFQEFIGIRMSPRQREELEALALERGYTLSRYVRELIAREAQRRFYENVGERDGG